MKLLQILKILLLVLMIGTAYSQAPKFDYGLSAYKKANCMGCHKWHGDGGPGYGGAALSLRETGLDREQLIKHFISTEFNRYLTYYKGAKDINSYTTSIDKKKGLNRKKFQRKKNFRKFSGKKYSKKNFKK